MHQLGPEFRLEDWETGFERECERQRAASAVRCDVKWESVSAVPVEIHQLPPLNPLGDKLAGVRV